MTTISHNTIREAAFRLIEKAATQYPKNYLEKLLAGFRAEESRGSKAVMASILHNIINATEGSLSLCQDTGIPVFHIYINPNTSLSGDVTEALGRGRY